MSLANFEQRELRALAPHAAPLRILVADDNPDTVWTLRVLLEHAGHIVRTSISGGGVVDLVREFQPDVCILDIEMPSQSGYAIAGELQALYGTLRPLMIAISGKWYRGSDRLLALGCGFDHFLEKPADPLELSQILDDMRRRRAAV